MALISKFVACTQKVELLERWVAHVLSKTEKAGFIVLLWHEPLDLAASPLSGRHPGVPSVSSPVSVWSP